MSDTYTDLPARIADAFPEIESDITMDLQDTNEEYAALSDEISGWKQRHPFIDKVMEGSGEIHLTAEEHTALAKYLSMKFCLEDMERLHIYFRGQTDAVAYLKKVHAI